MQQKVKTPTALHTIISEFIFCRNDKIRDNLFELLSCVFKSANTPEGTKPTWNVRKVNHGVHIFGNKINLQDLMCRLDMFSNEPTIDPFLISWAYTANSFELEIPFDGGACIFHYGTHNTFSARTQASTLLKFATDKTTHKPNTGN